MGKEQTSAARRRTRGEAERLAREFAASGLSRREFCERGGLKVSTLDAYRKRLRQRDGADRWVAVDIAGVTPHATASSIGAKPIAYAVARPSGVAVVLAGGRRIEVERGFDPATLGALLRVLERN
jgi:hypothetical protein